MSFRVDKINDLIRDVLAKAIQEEAFLDEAVFASIIKVDTSPDLRYARVLVSIFPEEERSSSMKILTKHIYKLQGRLNKQLQCNPLPRIEFISSDTEHEAINLEKLFQKIKEEREE